ncbi:glycosyltransferase family 9 protein [Noviherbaspirillum agri]
MLCAIPALRALRAALPLANITLVGLPWAQQFARRFARYIDDFIAFPGHPELPEQPLREELVPDFYQAMRAQEFDVVLQLHGSGEISNRIAADFGAEIIAGFTRHHDEGLESHFMAYPETSTEPERLLGLVEFLGAQPLGTELEFPLQAEDEQELQQSGLNLGLTPGHYICVHPGARNRAKCWAPQQFAQVADQLHRESGLPVVLTGSAQEADLTATVAAHMQEKSIDAAAPISIGAMAALMRHARLLVCNDTGVSHIAAALKLPSVVIFTATDMERWAPVDRDLHRCVHDPQGTKPAEALQQARALLARHAASRYH